MTPAMFTFLSAIAPRVVVVGGMARVFHGQQEITKDLDLLWDMDSEPARAVIEAAIAQAERDGIAISSQCPGNWTLRHSMDLDIEDMDFSTYLDTSMIELLPICYDGTYRQVRRRAVKGTFCGIELRFAA